MEMEDWVVYRIFQRKKRPHEKQGVISQSSNGKKARRLEMMRPSFMNSMLEDGSDLGGTQPASSCSSEITAVSSTGLDQEETSSRIRTSPF